MKSIHLIITLLALIIVPLQAERDEVDSQVEAVSQFLLNLISKYDTTGTNPIS